MTGGFRVVAAWPGLRVGDASSLGTLAAASAAVRESAPRVVELEWELRTPAPGRAELRARDAGSGAALAAFSASTGDDPPDPDGFANFLVFSTSGRLPERVERGWADAVFDAFVRTPAWWAVLEEADAPDPRPGPGVRAGLRTKARATAALPTGIPAASVRAWDPFVIVDVADVAAVSGVDAVLRRAGCLEPLPTLAQSGHAAAECPGVTASCVELATDAPHWRRLFRCRWCGTLWEQAEGVPDPEERVDAARAAADFPSWDGS